ncbi:MAG: nickel-responsive transcriptional regulator NikR [Candidatus Thorarchaeota archaeon]
MPVVSISLSSDLLKKLEDIMVARGFSSRSETIRDAIRNSISEFELSRFEEGLVTSTITIVSNHSMHDVDERLMRIRHENDDIVSGNLHIHLGKMCCLDILITEGEATKVLDFISKIRAMRGLQQVAYTIVPLTSAIRDCK